MFSYWERKQFSNYHNIIIGAGLAGLFTAINLKRKFPNEHVLVLDKEMFPAASTKNAGFACMGSITELEDDIRQSSLDEVIDLFEKRYLGLQMMLDELGKRQVGYTQEGSYELLYEKDLGVLDKVTEWNRCLYGINNRDAFSIDNIGTKHFTGFQGIIRNELEGAMDTGKLYFNLKSKAISLGVEIQMNMTVSKFEKQNGAYSVLLENGFELKARRLIVCTNAFTEVLLPKIKIKPARGQVLLAKPAKQPLFNGIYHFDSGYYYFRNIDGYVLFGGGRNIDAETEETNKFEANERILDDLQTKLREQIINNIPFEILYHWSGIMGKTSTKEPIMKQLDENLFILAGFGGMGVALAPYMAKKLIQLIS